MADHAALSPSGSKKWRACPAAPAMEATQPQTTSDYADEGTAAHWLAATCLRNGGDAEGYRGRVIEVTNGVVRETGADMPPKLRGQVFNKLTTVTVDNDMIFAVQAYLDAVRPRMEGHQYLVETRVPIDHLTGEEGAEGTTDLAIFDDGLLEQHDYKHGAGVFVSAVENDQMMIYSSGTLRRMEELGFAPPEQIKMVIHQPRKQDAPNEWSCSLEDLRKWEEAIKPDAYHALQVLKSEDPAAYIHHMHPGAHCHDGFCAARGVCPKVAQKVARAVLSVDEADFEDLTAEKVTVATEGVQNHTPKHLADSLALVDLIEGWCKAVRETVSGHLNNGRPVPGWKLVQGRKGARKWSDPQAAEAALKAMRVKRDQMYDYSVISPTQAEKLAKAEVIGKRQWPKLLDLITQGEGKPSVAPESDPRPALKIKPPEDDFDVVTPVDHSGLIAAPLAAEDFI